MNSQWFFINSGQSAIPNPLLAWKAGKSGNLYRMPSLGAVTRFEKHERHGVQVPGFSEHRQTGYRVSAHRQTQGKTRSVYRILNRRPQEVEWVCGGSH